MKSSVFMEAESRAGYLSLRRLYNTQGKKHKSCSFSKCNTAKLNSPVSIRVHSDSNINWIDILRWGGQWIPLKKTLDKVSESAKRTWWNPFVFFPGWPVTFALTSQTLYCGCLASLSQQWVVVMTSWRHRADRDVMYHEHEWILTCLSATAMRAFHSLCNIYSSQLWRRDT